MSFQIYCYNDTRENVQKLHLQSMLKLFEMFKRAVKINQATTLPRKYFMFYHI